SILSSSKAHGINPYLLLGTLVNESELDEKAMRVTTDGTGKVVAKDGGLGGVDCVLGKEGQHCINGLVRGKSWKELMDPAANIEATAAELAYFKDGGAGSWQTVKVRDKHGRLRPQRRMVPCRHKNHAWWVHFNHGEHYIDHGPARHYGHRVGVLYAALLRVS